MKNLTSESLPFKILLIALFACGCSTFHTGDVYREWTSRMGELGIYPVFPPREDISVGDVYLLPMHPYNSDLITYVGGLGMSGIHVGFLNGTLPEQGTNGESLAEMLTAEYTGRPSWPQLARDATTATNGLPYVDIPILGGTNIPDNRPSIFDGIPPRRLKEVAFPEFSVTVADQGSLSALVPVEAFMVNAGFDFSQVKSVSVKIPQAESYGIPANTLVGPFLNKFVLADTNGALYLETSNPFVNVGAAVLARSTFNESLYLTLKDSTAFGFWQWGKRGHLMAEVREHTNDLYLGLITEVYYARALDVSISSSAGFGGAAGARPVTPEDLLKLNELIQKAGTKGTTNQSAIGNATNNAFVVSNQPSMTGLQEDASAIDIAKQLQQLNYGQTTLGGAMQVVSASSHAIGLRRTFAYPVAVGVRGVILHFRCQPALFTAVDGTISTGFPLVNYKDAALTTR